MITVGVIRNGATYLTQHLRKNDYWAEGEKQVVGVWIGAGAKALGLVGDVETKAFEALRQNRHPRTGKVLTSRDAKRRMALFDVQLSAPKDLSVLAMVGGDARVREAFVESAKIALEEMERFAAVRERRGSAHGTEAVRLLGFSLLVCLGLGAMLCTSSIAYVFALKNNRPAHYDTDFFESVLIESGVLPLVFGPADQRPPNPFRSAAIVIDAVPAKHATRSVATARGSHPAPMPAPAGDVGERVMVENPSREKRRRDADELRTVPWAAYERLRDDLNTAEDALEDALSAGEEDGVCV